MGRLSAALLAALLLPLPAAADLTRTVAELDTAETPVVTTTYGAMRVTDVIDHVHPTPPDKTRSRLTACLRPGALRNGKVDLAAYDWPGPRTARDHELCLLTLFVVLGDREAVKTWVQAVIAPQANPDCPAVWDVKQTARWGPAAVHVWRSRRPTPLAIEVFDRAGGWGDAIRAPVHSLLRVTFDEAGLPLGVKYDVFTFGDRYGLARC